jgi:predicted GNAT family acetyltransferase
MDIELKIEKENERFVTFVEGSEAYVEYILQDDKINFTHTYTPPALRGKGIARNVVKFAFEYARQNDLKVIPTCPYIRFFLEKNEEYKELLA